MIFPIRKIGPPKSQRWSNLVTGDIKSRDERPNIPAPEELLICPTDLCYFLVFVELGLVSLLAPVLSFSS